jgi:hypothetical protein
MAKEPSKEIEFHPDTMQRFERAVSVVSKSPPQRGGEEKEESKEIYAGQQTLTELHEMRVWSCFGPLNGPPTCC